MFVSFILIFCIYLSREKRNAYVHIFFRALCNNICNAIALSFWWKWNKYELNWIELNNKFARRGLVEIAYVDTVVVLQGGRGRRPPTYDFSSSEKKRRKEKKKGNKRGRKGKKEKKRGVLKFLGLFDPPIKIPWRRPCADTSFLHNLWCGIPRAMYVYYHTCKII